MSTIETENRSPFGSKTSKGRLYGGFYLLIGGILLGLAALILFFIADAQGGRNEFNWREGALATGAVALPLILLGTSVALPTKAAMRILSVVGLAFSLLATVLFVVHYPGHFNTNNAEDYTSLDTGVYVVGLAGMLAATFTAILGYYLDRLRPAGAAEGEEEDDEFAAGYEVPDWVVERDIEYAMKKHGVELATGHEDRSIRVDIAGTLGDLSKAKVGGLGKARTVQLDAEQVDSSVAAMSQVRPGGKRAIPGEWADESVGALLAFRRAKAQNPEAFTPMKTGSWWNRFWGKVKGFFTGRSAGAPAPGPAPVALEAKPQNGGSLRGTTTVPSLPKRGKTIVIEDEAADKKAAAATRVKKGK